MNFAALLPGVLLIFFGSQSVAPAATYAPSHVKPPPLAREFRAAWVATVGNIDWPSKAGLSAAEQKAELIAILERAGQLRLNAIILQVRPGCDALYASALEPWSEYLTGQMGRAPSPFYDPLAFAVAEAHQRGIELHAWFNPFRAHHTKALSTIAASHVSRTHPQWVKTYGPQLWLDPGEVAVHEYSRQVILDVVKRYDIDGVHLDDYFYPYPERDAGGQMMPFPDSSTWQRYTAAGGKFTREEWRRDNVNRFIHSLYEGIKAEKPFVKFGVSPFGIWRPGNPEQIKGFDAYEQLFADSRKWLAQGWLDYFAPQLYWSIEPKEQSYPVLLKWWAEQNPMHRHLWPGDAPNRIGVKRDSAEIVNQVRLTRQQPGATGNIHWSMRALMQNKGGISDVLAREVYAQPALVPASTWLSTNPPGAPKLTVENPSGGSVKLNWAQAGAEPVWLWVFQTRASGDWTGDILSGRQTSHTFKANSVPDTVALTAVDRYGNAGPAAVWELVAGASEKK